MSKKPLDRFAPLVSYVRVFRCVTFNRHVDFARPAQPDNAYVVGSQALIANSERWTVSERVADTCLPNTGVRVEANEGHSRLSEFLAQIGCSEVAARRQDE